MNPTASAFVADFGRSLLHVAMPPLCIVCRSSLADTKSLCTACWTKLNFVEPPVCERLGTPFPYDKEKVRLALQPSPIRRSGTGHAEQSRSTMPRGSSFMGSSVMTGTRRDS